MKHRILSSNLFSEARNNEWEIDQVFIGNGIIISNMYKNSFQNSEKSKSIADNSNCRLMSRGHLKWIFLRCPENGQL
jgi:hypothetical protein